MNTGTIDPIAVIPAAGASARLGQPKQLIERDGRTLIADCVAKAARVCEQVWVVTGACHQAVSAALPARARVIRNTSWREGLGSSIAAAAVALPAGCPAVLVVMPDQPLVGADELRRLVDRWREHPDHLVCAAYGGTRGVPAVIPARLFAALCRLRGDRGARRMLRSDRLVIALAMPSANLDIDTPADLALLEGHP